MSISHYFRPGDYLFFAMSWEIVREDLMKVAHKGIAFRIGPWEDQLKKPLYGEQSKKQLQKGDRKCNANVIAILFQKSPASRGTFFYVIDFIERSDQKLTARRTPIVE